MGGAGRGSCMNLGLCLPPGYGGAVGSASGTVTDKRSRGAGRGITLEGTGRGAGVGSPWHRATSHRKHRSEIHFAHGEGTQPVSVKLILTLASVLVLAKGRLSSEILCRSHSTLPVPGVGASVAETWPCDPLPGRNVRPNLEIRRGTCSLTFRVLKCHSHFPGGSWTLSSPSMLPA